MSAEKYLQMIQQDIHSVVFATTDKNHLPVTCVIDIMLTDKEGLSITLRGETREIGQNRLSEIFEKNPYMEVIYPNMESRTALTVFQIYKGSGEFFDLSQKPVFREQFSFGGMDSHALYFFITDKCNGCNLCGNVCPQSCIDISVCPAKIEQEHCLHCGKCKEICPMQEVEGERYDTDRTAYIFDKLSTE